MKILRPFTGTGAVFFPLGQPPKGTCEHATEKCEAECYANKRQYPNFDEEILIPELEKKDIYEYFMTEYIGEIISQIKNNLDGLQTSILHWFGSGDCLLKDTERISEIINAVREFNHITQMGFTRNVELWEKHKDILSLTIEDKSEATDETAMYAMPDYNNQTSVMYNPSYQVTGGYCGPITCQDRLQPELEHYINCKTCLRLKTGCFDRR